MSLLGGDRHSLLYLYFLITLPMTNYLWSLLCYFSGIAWQLMLSRLGKQNKTGAEQVHSQYTNANEGDLCILIFQSLISADKAVIFHFLLPMT